MPRPIYIIVKLRTSILPPLKIIAAIHLFLSSFLFSSLLLVHRCVSSFLLFLLFFPDDDDDDDVCSMEEERRRLPPTIQPQQFRRLFIDNSGMEKEKTRVIHARLLSSFKMCTRCVTNYRGAASKSRTVSRFNDTSD